MNTTYHQFCVLSNTLFCSDFFLKEKQNMKCFVVFLMTLVVVNSFPLKNDEDSSLKRKVMSEIQQLCFFQMESLKILFSRLENLYWCLVNDQGYCWCLFINLFLWIQTTSRPYCFCF